MVWLVVGRFVNGIIKMIASQLVLGVFISQQVLAQGVASDVITVNHRDGGVGFQIGATEVARWVYKSDDVPRPHFAFLKTPSGKQVTRNHPPVEGADRIDHPGIHTGLWLSFGDISGNDPWRLKAKVKHSGFDDEPQSDDHTASFSALMEYLSDDGTQTLCKEHCTISMHVVDDGYLMKINSEFSPVTEPLIFGDQEEMGLGLRVATDLAVESGKGGRILDAQGRRNGQQIWGTTADWCDYSGADAGKWIGVTLFTSPQNFRPSWHHARDYGLVVANPFGRRAMTGGEVSRIEVPKGESLKLEFGVYVHESETEAECDTAAVYRTFVAP